MAAKIGQVVEVSDAELFKRCGGLTGHKVIFKKFLIIEKSSFLRNVNCLRPVVNELF